MASAAILAQSPSWDDQSHLIFKTSNGGTGAQERMRITSDGNVGIGTANPQAKLDVAGAIRATSLVVNGALSISGAVTVNGDMQVSGGFKVGVKPAPADADLRPVHIDMKTGMLHLAP